MRLSDLSVLSPALPTFVLAFAGVLGACLGCLVGRLAWHVARGEIAREGHIRCVERGRRSLSFGSPPTSGRSFWGDGGRRGRQKALRCAVAGLLGAVFFASMVWAYGLTVHAFALCALGCVLLGLSLVDLDTFTIPNGFVLAGVVIWMASFAFYDVDVRVIGLGTLMLGLVGSPALAVLADGLSGAFVIASVLLALSLAFEKAVGRQSLGGGDIKLLFLVGLFLGVAASALNLVVACVMGIVFALATRRARRDTDDPHVFPFGPSIALATWFTLMVGPQILGWYFCLF